MVGGGKERKNNGRDSYLGLVEGEQKKKKEARRSFFLCRSTKDCLTCRAESVVVSTNPGLRLQPADVDELGPVGIDQDRERDGLWGVEFFIIVYFSVPTQGSNPV